MKDLIGKTISQYRILEKLGEGGMGVVYKAEDTRLKRPVALKFLPAHLTRDKEANQRFIHEAQAASALDHPNVCTIFQVDETADGHLFIAMGYYEGETLKQKIRNGPLPVENALDIAIQIAAGLTQAHEKGIVHRDVNPSNIIVQKNGTVKIIDFGLTKLLSGERITETGTVKGTVAYMSPEQAKGEAVDHRTDIWALGVVLYEMLTTAKPFDAEYDQAVIFLILNHTPTALLTLNSGIPPSLENIILKALQKQPENRYQTVFDMLTDLKAVKDSEKPPNVDHPVTIHKTEKKRLFLNRKRNILYVFLTLLIISGVIFITQTVDSGNRVDSIAVLPLVNHSGDPEQAYFADGMTDALINDLAKIRSLRVISRTSSMHYKDTDKTIPEIARELNVDVLLEGSVRMIDGRVEVTTQLVDGRSDHSLWAGNYTRDLADILNLHHDITRAIARETRIPLTVEENRRFAGAQSVNPEAYRLFLQGRYFINGISQNPYKAVEFFEKAVKIDSTFALAYANLAITYNRFSVMGPIPQDESYRKGIAAAQKALALDDQLAEAHTALAALKFWHEWDWTGAEREFKLALNLNPGSADVYLGYLTLLVATQRRKEGIEIAQKMLDFDPLSPMINLNVGWAYFHLGNYEQSIKQLQYTAEMSPGSAWPHLELSWNYAVTGEFEKALKECEICMRSSNGADAPAAVGWVYAVCGETEKALDCLKALEAQHQKDPDFISQIAFVYAALGNNDKAFEYLERMYQKRVTFMALFKSDSQPNHFLSSLRNDPRYWDLLKRMNYPEN